MEKVLKIQTKEEFGIIDITEKVEEVVFESKIKDGICLVFVKGSTASIIINENEYGLLQDLKKTLEKLIPKGNYNHPSNAHSHLKATFLGPSKAIPIKDGKLDLGTWLSIFVINFDIYPREREIVIKILGK